MLFAAREAGRFFPMMTTAAGVAPAKVMVLGAGVAACRRSLPRGGSARSSPASTSGAPRGADRLARRPSAGVRLHPRRGGRGRLRAHAADRRGERAGTRGSRRERGQGTHYHDRADPRAPGTNPPHLAGRRQYGAGPVIVDLAGDSGGNCELTEPRSTVVSDNGVKVIAPANLASDMAAHASQLYGETSRTCSGC